MPLFHCNGEDLVYTYEQQIFIDEIQVYSRRHIQLSSTRDDSGGQRAYFVSRDFIGRKDFRNFFGLFFATHGQSISYRITNPGKKCQNVERKTSTSLQYCRAWT